MNKLISKRFDLINRRNFSRGFGVVAASSLINKKSLASDKVDVVVIGAGLAGLNAALNLEGEGYKVLVLEAADYIGGRTKTLDLPDGFINLGGQTIGPYYARVRDLAERLGVGLMKVPKRVPMGNFLNGTLVSSEDWPSSPANKTIGPERTVQPSALEFFYLSNNNTLPDVESWTDPSQSHLDISLLDFLNQSGASKEALRIIGNTINVFDLSTASALAYLRDIKRLQWGIADNNDPNRSTYGASDADGFEFNEIAGGTQRLLEAMSEALKTEVRLNESVCEINMDNNGVETRTLDGTVYRSRYVISAVPFSALKNIDVRPNFQGLQKDAIRLSTHGNTVRILLECSSNFWDNDIGEPGLYTDTAIERVFARYDESGRVAYLDCWINGNAAYRLDQLLESTVGDFTIKLLGKIRPSTKGKIKFVGIHSWAKHSPSGCCRHAFEAGQVGKWSSVMAKPFERLHLAGEQTRSIENGMEAAAKSGERAAFEIMERG